MIISQTPFRVSFSGGGTDLPAYYRQGHGAVLSVTIKSHMYVTVHKRFEPTFRVAYSKTELAENLDELEHSLVREALRKTLIKRPLEVTTIADVPAGTGMSSSSALTVGLLNALHAQQGRIPEREQLASEACEIEIDILGHPIGKQDQYAAAYGGLNYIRFNSDESVDVCPVPITSETQEELQNQLLLFFTEQKRDANQILRQQTTDISSSFHVLTEMRNLVETMRQALTGSPDLEEFARCLNHGWELKRSLGGAITNEKIDAWYAAAKQAGAQGGKLLGAGGGGFLLIMAPPECHDKIRSSLGNPREIPFQIDPFGSRIVFISR
ncbi:MAG: GHMP kinase [Planctomycetaceae bacterium]|nr:GHMP kinase [Planctomycetaceae bacterium]MBP63843.1 GHMP kinase [Planctomycetaceae bacterium]